MTNEEIRRLVMEATAKVTKAVPIAAVQHAPPPQAEVRTGGTLVLLPAYGVFPREAFLQQHIGAGQVILAGFGERASTNFQYWDLKTDDGTSRLLESLDGFGAVYLYAPGFSMLEKLVALEDEDPLVFILLQRLLAGREAGICFDQDPAAAAPGLKTRLEACITSLKSLGFSIRCTPCGGAAQKEPKTETISRKVLLEEDILALHQQGQTTLHMGEGAALTPLAADRARELGMEIQR